MPNDLSIRPVAPSVPDHLAPPAAIVAQAKPEANVSANGLPNPTMRLDPVLGLVVIEFHNRAGSLTQSIPGQRQLDAYRMAREFTNARATPPGADPPVHPSATRTV